MSLIAAPAMAFANVDSMTLQRYTNTLRSPYSGIAQRLAMPFAVWMFQGTLIPYTGLQAGAIRSFFVNADGQANDFKFPIPGMDVPLSGYQGAAALANGAAAAGAFSMSIDGLTASALYLADGDFFTIPSTNELKMCIGGCQADANGKATLSFKPALRKAVADNAALQHNAPYMYAQMNADDAAKFSLSIPVIHGFTADFVESIGA